MQAVRNESHINLYLVSKHCLKSKKNCLRTFDLPEERGNVLVVER